MLDFKGQELNVGDNVVMIDTEWGVNIHVLREGVIVRFTPLKCEVKYMRPTWSKMLVELETTRLVYPNTLYKLA